MEINKTLLKKLYWGRGLSITQIAKKFHCDPATVHRRMKKYGIKRRSLSEAKRKFIISKEKLKRLYKVEKLSTFQIGKKFGVSHATVLNRMKEFKIKRRSRLGSRKPVKVSKSLLKRLYEKEKLSENQIAKRLGCSHHAIEVRMKKYNIKPRSYSEANTKYPKRDFSENLVEKAYLIGFRLGDLYMYRKDFVIVVGCSTTRPEQIQLIKDLFSPYSKVCVRKARILSGKQEFRIRSYLNSTFDFLLPGEDKIKPWILKNKKFFFAFLGGYIDAEGHIFTKLQKKSKTPAAGLETQSYDKNILHQAWKKLNRVNIQCPKPRINKPKGYINKYGAVYREDLWRLGVNRKQDLFSLLTQIEPFVKHRKRKIDLQKAKENLIPRLRRKE